MDDPKGLANEVGGQRRFVLRFHDDPHAPIVKDTVAHAEAIPAAVAAVLAGDAARFGDIVRAFDGLVRRTVARSLRDAHAA